MTIIKAVVPYHKNTLFIHLIFYIPITRSSEGPDITRASTKRAETVKSVREQLQNIDSSAAQHTQHSFRSQQRSSAPQRVCHLANKISNGSLCSNSKAQLWTQIVCSKSIIVIWIERRNHGKQLKRMKRTTKKSNVYFRTLRPRIHSHSLASSVPMVCSS